MAIKQSVQGWRERDPVFDVVRTKMRRTSSSDVRGFYQPIKPIGQEARYSAPSTVRGKDILSELNISFDLGDQPPNTGIIAVGRMRPIVIVML